MNIRELRLSVVDRGKPKVLYRSQRNLLKRLFDHIFFNFWFFIGKQEPVLCRVVLKVVLLFSWFYQAADLTREDNQFTNSGFMSRKELQQNFWDRTPI